MHRESSRRISIVESSAVPAVVTQGPMAGTTLVLQHAAHLIGRPPTADIWLDDLTVSLRSAVTVGTFRSALLPLSPTSAA